jgi:hypothetical protein
MRASRGSESRKLTESPKAIRPVCARYLTFVGPLKLLGQLIEVGKGQFSGIRLVADGEVRNLVHQEVTECE